MNTLQQKIITKIKNDKLQKFLMFCNFGLEKENLRVDLQGNLALTDHPEVFGNKKDNPYITTDFSESQVEMVTPPCNTLNELYDFMGALNDIVSSELKNEVLWPQSNPPILPEEQLIPIAKFNGEVEEKYRELLAEKYGRKKQLISGIHYNFSFKNEFLQKLYEDFEEELTFKEFKNKIYLNIAKNFFKYKWLLIYLTGASPVFHESYIKDLVNSADKLDNITDSYYFKNINSLRNSKFGYKNTLDFSVSYNSLEEYISDLSTAINNGTINNEKEYYSPIRLKAITGKGNVEDLKKYGVEYLEIRILDLDPLSEFGISLDTLKLLHAFVLSMAFMDTKFEVSNFNQDKDFVSKSLDMINEVISLLDNLEIFNDDIKLILEKAKEEVIDPAKTKAYKIISEIKKSSFIDYHLNRAKLSLNESNNRIFSLRGFEDMELSTQILLRDAIKRGIKFEIADRYENFISLKKDNKVEYVKQATKTSKDTYITALLMENKEVTKKILSSNNIRVPKGELYLKPEDAKLDFKLFENKGIVIKPKTTNFGLGISIFKNGFTKEEFEKGIDIAFSEDSSILIEEFISGKEYRFLVIDNEIVGILHRVPANVTGNGVNTIKELVEIKNEDFLRGVGYVKPLEKIKLGVAEEMFLHGQNLDFNYIPKKNETIYLRENSNISTGGDSLDFTDQIHDSYKEVAIKAAKAANAKITGIDIMIQNISEEANELNHAIIEMNFNPAIHIHCFPYKGINRHAGEKVLDLLFNK